MWVTEFVFNVNQILKSYTEKRGFCGKIYRLNINKQKLL